MNLRVGGVDLFFHSRVETSSRLDELNSDKVPPINIRIDFPKGESTSSLPVVALKMQDRSIKTTSHALDILVQNLEEIFTAEEKLIRKGHPPKLPPIDMHLNNVQFTLEV